MNIAVAHGGGLGACIAAGLDVAQVIAHEQHAGRVQVEHLAGQQQRLGVGLALADVRLDHVVDVDVGRQLVVLGQRVVGQACDVLDLKSGIPAPRAQLGRANEFLEVMGAPRQQVHDVFGANDGEQ
nr:hypothetical protein [Tanacetum cinerariifolium]